MSKRKSLQGKGWQSWFRCFICLCTTTLTYVPRRIYIKSGIVLGATRMTVPLVVHANQLRLVVAIAVVLPCRLASCQINPAISHENTVSITTVILHVYCRLWKTHEFVIYICFTEKGEEGQGKGVMSRERGVQDCHLKDKFGLESVKLLQSWEDIVKK